MPCRLVLPHPSHPPLIPIPQGGPPSPFFAKQNEQFGCPFGHGYPPRRPPIRHASARRGRLFRSQTLARWIAGSSPSMTIESRGTPSPPIFGGSNGNFAPDIPPGGGGSAESEKQPSEDYRCRTTCYALLEPAPTAPCAAPLPRFAREDQRGRGRVTWYE